MALPKHQRIAIDDYVGTFAWIENGLVSEHGFFLQITDQIWIV